MDITMPQLGETVTEGTITRWLKQVGEHIEPDEALFEVSTDKVDSEVPAPAGGYLTEIRISEGETAPVGTVLAVIGDTPAAGAAPTAEPAQPAPTPDADITQPSPIVSLAPPPPAAPAPPPPAAPAPAPPSEPPAPLAPPRPPAPAPAAGGGGLTSPIVRRMLAEAGLDAAAVRGTGDGGRITRKDVEDAAAARTAPPGSEPSSPAPVVTEPPPPSALPPALVVAEPPPPAPVPPTPPTVEPPSSSPPSPVVPIPAEGGTQQPGEAADEVEPFTNIRRRTAEHMVRSKATSAHVYTSVEVDFEPIARLRARHQDQWKQREGFSLTYLPFVARAFGAAVEQFPNVNASVGDQALVVHRRVNLGIAVDLDFHGLVAPVIRDADGKRLRLLAREIRDLATRARSKQLAPDDVLGATFTITNPGPYGTFMTLPIISQPQVAILSTDGVHKRPTVITGADGADVIAVRHVGILVLTWDHRAFDGAYAAAFLRAVKQDLETRDWEAELA